MTDTAEFITFDRRDHIAILRLNRPDNLNAWTIIMMNELIQALDMADHDDGVRAIIVTGAGRAFCAGADLKKHAAGDRTEAQKRKYIMLGQHATRALYEFPKPTIAAINGPARGAGVAQSSE